MAFQLRLLPAAAGEMRTIPPATKQRLRKALRELARDPTGKAGRLDVKALASTAPQQAAEPAFRLRVGEWRVVYVVRSREVLVVRVFHRGEGYGWLDRLDAGRGGPRG